MCLTEYNVPVQQTGCHLAACGWKTHSGKVRDRLSDWHLLWLIASRPANAVSSFRTREKIAYLFHSNFTFWWFCICLNIWKIKSTISFLKAVLSEWLDLLHIFTLQFCPVIRWRNAYKLTRSGMTLSLTCFLVIEGSWISVTSQTKVTALLFSQSFYSWQEIQSMRWLPDVTDHSAKWLTAVILIRVSYI
jgi:hypothetical protein